MKGGETSEERKGEGGKERGIREIEEPGVEHGQDRRLGGQGGRREEGEDGRRRGHDRARGGNVEQ